MASCIISRNRERDASGRKNTFSTVVASVQVAVAGTTVSGGSGSGDSGPPTDPFNAPFFGDAALRVV
jgi:hypothetical protein